MKVTQFGVKEKFGASSSLFFVELWFWLSIAIIHGYQHSAISERISISICQPAGPAASQQQHFNWALLALFYFHHLLDFIAFTTTNDLSAMNFLYSFVSQPYSAIFPSLSLCTPQPYLFVKGDARKQG